MKEFENKIEEIDSSVNPRQTFWGNQIIHAPQPTITAPSGGATVDSQARTAINTVIARLVALGLLDES
jgi:hypothetical protein